MATVLMAIDPGKSGAIALQSGPNDTIAVYSLANMSESEIVTVIRVARRRDMSSPTRSAETTPTAHPRRWPICSPNRG